MWNVVYVAITSRTVFHVTRRNALSAILVLLSGKMVSAVFVWMVTISRLMVNVRHVTSVMIGVWSAMILVTVLNVKKVTYYLMMASANHVEKPFSTVLNALWNGARNASRVIIPTMF